MKLHEEWQYKAQNDLDSARLLFNSGKNLLDICVYHTQQWAEKALKAFLVYKEQEIDKTHNLITLISKCKIFDINFEELKDEAIFLNPFSTQFRYPAGDMQPLKTEAEKAILCAETILFFVKDKIAEDIYS